ncbi:MAG: RsmD family RNA methyltransferase [Bacteriovoracia bacterium]
MLRITSGILRNIRIDSPDSKNTRPTLEKIRQAIFNVLRNQLPLENCKVLDLFAGSGAYGFESASNGASSVHFFESNKVAMGILKKNIQTIEKHFASQQLEVPTFQIHFGDALRLYQKIDSADLIFLDPPYEAAQTVWSKFYEHETARPVCRPNGFVVFETDENTILDAFPLGGKSVFRLLDRKIYSDSAVHFFVKQ